MQYKYICVKCGSAFEFEATEQEMTGGLKVFCPACKNEACSRVLSGESGTKTGAYVYSKEMNRLVKVSDRASVRPRGGCAPDGGPCSCGGQPQ